VSEGLSTGVKNSSRQLLGGDLSIELSHRPIPPAALTFLKRKTNVSEMKTMRAMARPLIGGKRTLVELKAIDDLYPLVGKIKLKPIVSIKEALASQDDRPGAIIAPALSKRLGLNIGDIVRIGGAEFIVRAEIISEPDRVIRFSAFGPRIIIHSRNLEETGLLTEGSLVKFIYKVSGKEHFTESNFIAHFNKAFPSAGWRIRTSDNAAPGFDRFNRNVTQFLTLIGFTTLLVGGLGIANAVRNLLDQKTSTIATLKCLGADNRLVFTIYFFQTAIISIVCIGIGISIGAALPIMLADFMSKIIPITIPITVFWKPISVAALYGLLVTFIFTIWPLANTQNVQPGDLFRSKITNHSTIPSPICLAWMIIASIMLAGIAIWANEDRKLTTFFILGAIVLLLSFTLGAHFTKKLCQTMPVSRKASLRLALSNIYRPGNLTTSIIISLGLGLTLLLTVATIEDNLSQRLDSDIPKIAPSYFFIDIQPNQNISFTKIVRATPGINRLETTPMVRGRLIRINEIPVEKIKPDNDVAWAIRGDRGLTYVASKPLNTRLVRGKWWPENYIGPPLLSMDANVARGINAKIGDIITFNILGREISAKIMNLRYIDWSSLEMNFVFIFAPGTLESAPHSIIATVYADNLTAEENIRNIVTDKFPNISAIGVKDALQNAREILNAVSATVRTSAVFTLLSGIIVLAGALSSQQQKRTYDATILKILGAPRRQIIVLYLSEYAILSTVSAVLATIIAMLISWLVLTRVMRTDFNFDSIIIFGTLLVSLLLTMTLGLIGTWHSLNHRPGRALTK
tara:strand:+ start:264 stop:2663 length:2400 start_codon:yes stop_codon:yes gene_type:complete